MNTENNSPNPNTDLLAGFERMFAQWERERIIQRLRAGKQGKAQERAKGGQQ